MSLDRSEQARTAAELRRHVELCGLSHSELAGRLGLEPSEVDRALAVNGADPVTVWLVRDALHQVAREQGVDAGGWTVLTDAARVQALRWFDLRPVPPRPARAFDGPR